MVKTNKQSRWAKILIFLAVFIGVILIANIISKSFIEKKIRESFNQFMPYIKTGFASVRVNLFNASVTFDSIAISYHPNLKTQNKHEIYFRNAGISGINFFKLIGGKNLSASAFKINNGKIILNKYLLNSSDTLPASLFTSLKIPFKNLSLGKIELANVDVYEDDSLHQKKLLNANIFFTNVNLKNVGSSFSENNIQFSNVKCELNNIKYDLTDHNGLSIKKVSLNSKDSSLQVDSLNIPQFELGNNLGHHADYIHAEVLSLKAEHLDVKGLMDKKIYAGSVTVNKSKIYLLRDRNLSRQIKQQPMTSSLKVNEEKINPGSQKIPFKNILLGKIELNNVDVYEGDASHQKRLLNANISFADVKPKNIDSSFSKNNIQFSNVKCELNNIKYDLPGYHTLSIKKLLLKSKDSSLQIESVNIIPQLGKFELGNKLGHQVDCIHAEVSSVKAEHLDVKKLADKKFYAGSVTINKSKIYVFRDRRLPREMKQQPMPLDYLKKMPADIYIHDFNLKNTSVTSEEFPKDGPQTGYIKIDNINISASPFFNHAQKNNASVTSHVSGSIMDAGILDANINLSLITGNQTIHGFIENLELPAMNPSAENLGKFKVESGILNKLDFDFIATNQKASGQIIGVYHNLVIDRLKIKDGKLKEAKMPSLALHHIIIPKNKDASLNVKHRTGKIDYDRDPTRLVTFYLLKSLLDGIRDSFALGFVLPK